MDRYAQVAMLQLAIVVVAIVDSRRWLDGEPSVLTWYFACGLCGLLEPTQNRDILDWRPWDPAVPREELITLNVMKNVYKLSTLDFKRFVKSRTLSVYTRGSRMRRVTVSGHDTSIWSLSAISSICLRYFFFSFRRA